jgi:hypothetical protein
VRIPRAVKRNRRARLVAAGCTPRRAASDSGEANPVPMRKDIEPRMNAGQRGSATETHVLRGRRVRRPLPEPASSRPAFHLYCTGVRLRKVEIHHFSRHDTRGRRGRAGQETTGAEGANHFLVFGERGWPQRPTLARCGRSWVCRPRGPRLYSRNTIALPLLITW